ncbi:MAG: hypothetical protein U7123_13265 [Potamolinea sp.]
MFVNDLPTDIKDYELLKSMTLKQLLDLRATSKEWNARVLRFLKLVWLPQKKAQLDDMGVEIEASYNSILDQTNAATIRTRDPGLIMQFERLQPKLNEALKLIETMLNVMEKVLHLNSFPWRSGTKISQADLILWQGKLTQYKERLVGILRRMGPEYESEMELSMSMKLNTWLGEGKKMTAAQKRQIMAAIDDCLRAREHTSGVRGSTRQTHQQGMARRRQDMFNSAKRAYQVSGRTFQSVLDQVKRC